MTMFERADLTQSFEVVEGAEDSPVILHVPHSSTRIPDWVREHVLLDDGELGAELLRMTDAHTDLLAHQAAGAAGVSPRSGRPWLFVNRLSRLVVDPERFPDEREELETVGMGAVYARTSQGLRLRAEDQNHRLALLEAYFNPYASAFTDLVEQRLAATGGAVIIDVHSFPPTALPYELHADAHRPQICLGVDPFHTPHALLAAARRCFATWETAVNEPFAGSYVPLQHYERDTRVSSLMVEARRDTYQQEPGGPPNSGMASLAVALAELVRCAQLPAFGTRPA